MKISKKWAWGVLVLILVFFIFCLSLTLFQSVTEGAGDIIIVHDSYAETQAYETFFMVFTEELLRFKEKNPEKISGQHRIFIMEFYRLVDPKDFIIFLCLDLNQTLKEPILIDYEWANNLKSSKAMKIFADKAIKNLVRIINEKGAKKYEI